MHIVRLWWHTRPLTCNKKILGKQDNSGHTWHTTIRGFLLEFDMALCGMECALPLRPNRLCPRVSGIRMETELGVLTDRSREALQHRAISFHPFRLKPGLKQSTRKMR